MPVINLYPRPEPMTGEIQRAFDRVGDAGGGIVRLHAGIHYAGTLHFRSGLRLEILPGATLHGLPEPDAYAAISPPLPSRMDVVPWKTFLYAENCERISLGGGGTLHGAGDEPCFANARDNDPARPYGLHFVNCRQVTVSDLHLHSSAFWMQRYFACDGVRLRGLEVHNHANQNNDGVDIDSSRDVIVSDCQFDTSDDAICLKSEGALPTRDVTISNCILGTHASGFKIGTGSVGGFENITVRGLVMRSSRAASVVHPLQRARGITGIDISSIDGGALRQLHVSDIIMEGFDCPLLLRQGRRLSRTVARQGYGGGDSHQGINQPAPSRSAPDAPEVAVSESRCFSDVVIQNITARDLGGYPMIATGCPGAPIRRLALRHINLHHRHAPPADECTEPSSYSDDGYTGPGMWGSFLPAHGLFAREIEELVLRNVRSRAANGDHRPEILSLPSLDPAVAISS